MKQTMRNIGSVMKDLLTIILWLTQIIPSYLVTALLLLFSGARYIIDWGINILAFSHCLLKTNKDVFRQQIHSDEDTTTTYERVLAENTKNAADFCQSVGEWGSEILMRDW